MKRTQGVFVKGYTTIRVKGKFPEFFLNRCVDKGIVVWNVKKIDESTCEANVKLEDVSRLKKLRYKTPYKVHFHSRIGMPFLFQAVWKRKPLLIGFLFCLALIFILSNMVWGIDVEGVTPEIEHKIEESLSNYGVKKGAWKLSLDSPSEMQQKLLNDVPELLWIGITEKGTTYHLQGVEKTIVEKEEAKGPQHLVAKKKGTIVYMYIEKGEPKVEINDVVKPGDMLVSGLIGREEEQKSVRAEGEVIADTWYTSELSVPLEAEYQVLTGEEEKRYFLNLFNVAIPIWGFKEPDYTIKHVEKKEHDVHFFSWRFPVTLSTKNIHEQESYKEQRSVSEAVKEGIQQAKQELMNKLPIDSKIISEKILHQQKENGKVKLILYFKVHENIVTSYPITQGD
ncbi:sporulation protein YqfD [Pontibacillus salicampi]|uniref:Sporulation protein YqfD n=1 Tax=Pontibacillus salicampi TaxID=1449801 RepID=A0ABV6LJJ8_9BACI